MKTQNHLIAAQGHLQDLREKVLRELAHAIGQRAWTQAETAAYLGVRQPRISDLVRGKTEKFTLDTLVEMLFALDKPVQLVFTGDYRRSRGWEQVHSEAEEKIAYYTAVLRHDPTNLNALKLRAVAYEGLSQFQLALGDLTRWCELAPDRPGPLSNRMNTYRLAGDYRAALLDAQTLLERFPDYNIYQNRALIYLDMGDCELALADMNRAIELDPDRPGPWSNRAFLYRQQGRLEEAKRDYRKALELDPTSRHAAEVLKELEPLRNENEEG